MKRNGLLVAAGIIGIVRGALGLFGGIGSLALLERYDRLIPGAGAIMVFEVTMSLVILIVSIWALVKANDPVSASAIKAWGGLIIAAGVIDLFWSIALMGSQAMATAVGSVVALALIGGLLIAGATSLERRAAVTLASSGE